MTFVWVYGIFMGGYSYSLKMYVYQKVRARNFAKAWGYVQCSQALPNMFGIPLAGYINIGEWLPPILGEICIFSCELLLKLLQRLVTQSVTESRHTSTYIRN